MDMNVLRSHLLAFPLSVLTSLGAAASATTLELDLLPINGPEVTCPAMLIAYETAQPPFEGGYARDGMIQLRDVATNIRVLESDEFSTTWVGDLKPEFANCEGTAIINTVDGEPYQTHSYLQVKLMDGQVMATLDMTGIPDANGFTSTLLFGGMRDGNPRWTWGGTD